MQNKVLLVGNNEALIDDFFKWMDEKYSFLTTSCRMEDVLGHFKCFQPDVLLYCMSEEGADSIKEISLAMARFVERKIPVVLIADAQDSDLYVQVSGEQADRVIPKNLTSELMRLKLMSFFSENEIKREMNTPKPQVQPDFAIPAPPKMETNQQSNFNFDNFMAMLNEPQVEDTADEGGPRKEKHILVVDDDVRMLKVLKEQLHNEYDVATAVSGKIALRFLANKTTDLIILDYEMPDEDGPAILEKLRANPSTKNIPVIFLTGITRKEKIEKALVMRPQGYLLKPVNHKKLMSTIARIFNGD